MVIVYHLQEIESIVGFMYGEYIEISPTNIERIIEIASFLQLNTLMKMIVDIVGWELDKNNCIYFNEMTEKYQLDVWSKDIRKRH